MKYNWCLGIILDRNCCEKTCQRRNRCVYYAEDLFRRFSREHLEEDFLLNEPGYECQYFIEREGVRPEKEETNDDPFLLMIGKNKE